jgi:hypothetical protein
VPAAVVLTTAHLFSCSLTRSDTPSLKASKCAECCLQVYGEIHFLSLLAVMREIDRHRVAWREAHSERGSGSGSGSGERAAQRTFVDLGQ